MSVTWRSIYAWPYFLESIVRLNVKDVREVLASYKQEGPGRYCLRHVIDTRFVPWFIESDGIL